MIEDLVVVAAGAGSRLKSMGEPKPLVSLAGKSLIEWALSNAFAAGLDRAIVVTGYKAAALEAHLEALRGQYGWRIDTAHNPDFGAPNGLSVLRARALVAGPFCLAMCDHLVEPRLYRSLLDADIPTDSVALGIDRRLDNPLVDLDDVTRVHLEGRYIRDIGKGLSRYNAFDTGIFAAGPALFEALEASGRDEGDFSISGGMKRLAAEGRAIGIDVGDACWIDIDNPRMHALAESWLRSSGTAGV